MPNHYNIRQRLRTFIQPDRILHTNQGASGDGQDQQLVWLAERQGLSGSGRRPVHQLPFQQFDPTVLT